ncbi:hypothetical protein AADEFJLK_02603 [Methylovulum psychrotolerans]|uniref:Uncharacterized protein n=1 Tax=Methylovulum psychrotolerans TaxID=1704499 RepID=A0A2S5CLN9_9GAMM|nr:hypothetical protein AADEFJLK_02603 [Methylovulum psychrotolerans]
MPLFQRKRGFYLRQSCAEIRHLCRFTIADILPCCNRHRVTFNPIFSGIQKLSLFICDALVFCIIIHACLKIIREPKTSQYKLLILVFLRMNRLIFQPKRNDLGDETEK